MKERQHRDPLGIGRAAALLFVSAALAACAHPSAAPPIVEAVAAPRVPLPVSLTVRELSKGTLGELIPETDRRVRVRLEEQGHQVRGDAELTLEIDLVSFFLDREGRVPRFCVLLQGRLIRPGAARFSAMDTVKQRCADQPATGSWGGTGWGALVGLGLAVAESLLTPSTQPTAEARLYVGALEELTDALGAQATR